MPDKSPQDEDHDGICPQHGPVSGFLAAPRYAGEARDPRGTGERYCSKCGLTLAQDEDHEAWDADYRAPKWKCPACGTFWRMAVTECRCGYGRTDAG